LHRSQHAPIRMLLGSHSAISRGDMMADGQHHMVHEQAADPIRMAKGAEWRLRSVNRRVTLS